MEKTEKSQKTELRMKADEGEDLFPRRLRLVQDEGIMIGLHVPVGWDDVHLEPHQLLVERTRQLHLQRGKSAERLSSLGLGGRDDSDYAIRDLSLPPCLPTPALSMLPSSESSSRTGSGDGKARCRQGDL